MLNYSTTYINMEKDIEKDMKENGKRKEDKHGERHV